MTQYQMVSYCSVWIPTEDNRAEDFNSYSDLSRTYLIEARRESDMVFISALFISQ